MQYWQDPKEVELAVPDITGTVLEHISLPVSNVLTVKGEPNTLVQQGVNVTVAFGSAKLPVKLIK